MDLSGFTVCDSSVIGNIRPMRLIVRARAASFHRTVWRVDNGAKGSAEELRPAATMA